MGIYLLLFGFYLASLMPMFAWASPLSTPLDPRLRLREVRTNSTMYAPRLRLREIPIKSTMYAPPLTIPGNALAAKISKRATGDLPPIQFSDDAEDTPGEPQILTNFVEAGVLDRDWSTPVCKMITNFQPTTNGNSGIFNYNVQGTHKQGLSLVHQKRYLNFYATFTTTDATQLPKYDLMNLCKSAFHQAAQTNHELKYGFFGIQTVFSAINNHLVQIQPSSDERKRSSFGGPIGIINIQFGDAADGVGLFNGNGLPPVL